MYFCAHLIQNKSPRSLFPYFFVQKFDDLATKNKNIHQNWQNQNGMNVGLLKLEF